MHMEGNMKERMSPRRENEVPIKEGKRRKQKTQVWRR